MTVVAAIDCGTNSIRLLVAEVDEPSDDLPSLGVLERQMRIVRLGEGVDREGRLAEAAMRRTFDALEEFAALSQRHGVTRTRMVATSATRDAENSDAFAAGVRSRIGVEPDVITGDEEASLAFLGATTGLPSTTAPEPRLVVDIGGGSTEVVLGRPDGIVGLSVDIGCVRLTERYLADDPPSAEQRAAATSAIDSALDRVAQVVPLREAGSLIGLAGTVTTMAAIHLGLTEYDPASIHHSVLPATACQVLSDSLLTSTHDERSALGPMHPGRVDVIGAGSLVLARLVARTGLDVVVSEHDILDGIAYSLLDGAGSGSAG